MLKRLYKELTYGGIHRIKETIKPYLSDIDACPPAAQSKVREQILVLDRIQKKSLRVYYIQIVLYILLYASIISAVFGNVFVLGEVIGLFTLVSGVLGPVIVFLLIAYMHRRMRLYLSDAHVVSTLILTIILRYKKFELSP